MRSFLGRIASLFQEMHAFVALHSGYEPVRLKFRQDKKVARCNWRSNLPKILALIHDRGMKRHKAKRPKASIGPMRTGSCKTDAVSDSSAMPPSSQAYIVELGQGQAIT